MGGNFDFNKLRCVKFCNNRFDGFICTGSPAFSIARNRPGDPINNKSFVPTAHGPNRESSI